MQKLQKFKIDIFRTSHLSSNRTITTLTSKTLILSPENLFHTIHTLTEFLKLEPDHISLNVNGEKIFDNWDFIDEPIDFPN